MKLTNKFNTPDAIVAAIQNDPYTKDGADFSVTELISPPQIRRLWKKHDDEISVDVREEVWKLLGKGVHTALEQAESAGTKEKRFHAEHEGVTISGAVDLIEDDGSVTDYKVTHTGSVKRGLKQDWEKQLNLYAWLLRQNDVTVTSLNIVAICRDWTVSQVGKYRYPDSMVVTLRVPVWSESRQDRYLAERVRIHSMESTLPCTTEERWAQGAYKVTGGRGRPKPFDSRHEAEQHLMMAENPKLKIVEAKAKYIRCERWCDVSAFCPQWTHANAAFAENDFPIVNKEEQT
jgi:hypothetical protein|tara:strand:- start:1791 stop:2660 length:870 start_codon:yes stop_codon:yes gene_type:complete